VTSTTRFDFFLPLNFFFRRNNEKTKQKRKEEIDHMTKKQQQ